VSHLSYPARELFRTLVSVSLQLETECGLVAADAEAEVNAVGKWIDHQHKSPEALKEFLRRRFPHWNVPDRRETEVSVREDTNKDVIEARVQEFFEELKRRQIKVED
jgi:hypothetical protein